MPQRSNLLDGHNPGYIPSLVYAVLVIALAMMWWFDHQALDYQKGQVQSLQKALTAARRENQLHRQAYGEPPSAPAAQPPK